MLLRAHMPRCLYVCELHLNIRVICGVRGDRADAALPREHFKKQNSDRPPVRPPAVACWGRGGGMVIVAWVWVCTFWRERGLGGGYVKHRGS